MASSRTVLLVEADPALLDSLGFALRRRGYHVLTALDGNRAAELLARNLPDVAVLGMMLPGQSGFQITRLVKEQAGGQVPVVMLAESAAAAHRDYALAVGVDRFLAKRLAAAELVAAIEAVCPLSNDPRRPGSGSISWPTATPA